MTSTADPQAGTRPRDVQVRDRQAVGAAGDLQGVPERDGVETQYTKTIPGTRLGGEYQLREGATLGVHGRWL